MAHVKNHFVDLPETHIARVKSGNTTYIYHILRYYRNKEGKPRNDRILIGKLDKEKNKLIPNLNYFNILNKPYPQTITPEKEKLKNINGVTQLVTKITKSLKLDVFLKNNFECWKEIIDLATYTLVENKAMQYVPDFQDENFIFGRKMDSPTVSKMLDKIGKEDIPNFFKQWANERKKEEYLAYDVTSISSYSQNICELDYGYNRDLEKLTQINLAMLVGEKTSIPVSYEYYNGAIPDKVKIVDMIEEAIRLDLQGLTFVMDQGFDSAKNREFLENNNFKFIMPVSSSRKDIRELIESKKTEVQLYDNSFADPNVEGGRSVINGAKFKIDNSNTFYHIFYNAHKFAVERDSLHDEIEYIKLKLLQLKNKKKAVPSRYQELFSISNAALAGENLEWVLDTSKIQQEIGRLGYFVLSTNRADLSSEELLSAYRKRNLVESVFDSYKNELGYNRLKVHKSSTLKGKLFVGFIALIFRCFIEREKRLNDQTSNLSCTKIFKLLSSININAYSDILVVKQLSKKQREICEAFEIINSLQDIPKLE